jgi:hypothetical protein
VVFLVLIALNSFRIVRLLAHGPVVDAARYVGLWVEYLAGPRTYIEIVYLDRDREVER